MENFPKLSLLPRLIWSTVQCQISCLIFLISYRICSPQVIRVPRDVDYKYIQKQILKSLGLAVPDDVIIRADVSFFFIRMILRTL